MFSLNHPIKSFAVANDFVVTTNKACYQLGKQLSPFCIYANDKQKEYGVIDFSTFDGFQNASIPLVDELSDVRKKAYSEEGINLNTDDPLAKKLLFFDYLMSISICYVEVPKYVTKEGFAQASFDKFLCTRNPAIMGAWMGLSASEMQAKYSARIRAQYIDMNDNVLRFVKLQQGNKGNSITVPRTAYSVEKMTCIPLYMLYAWVEGMKSNIEEGIVQFSFLKDNGTVRDLATTLNQDILRDYYSDSMFINTMLSGVDINTVQQGGMSFSSKMHRGYIKVPELGASIYDGTGVRSLNIARLLKAERVSEVDRTFINVALSSVVENFENGIDYLLKTMETEMPACYTALTGEAPEDSVAVNIATKAKDYARGRSVVLSTTFHRSLHMFMVNNPQWFPLYTGKPNATVTSSANYGVTPMDF